MRDGGFFSHWALALAIGLPEFFLWIAVIILVVVLAKAIIQKNKN